MQKFMKKRKARGFTLVELLIVIIIIGILSGALLLVAGAGTDKANATKIVSNLRNGKAAAIMVYADYNEWPTEVASLTPYLESKFEEDDYEIIQLTSDDVDGYYLGFTDNADSDNTNTLTTGITEKLENMTNAGDTALYDASGIDYTSGEGNPVYMKLN
jgi:general secretion pathway protein G